MILQFLVLSKKCKKHNISKVLIIFNSAVLKMCVELFTRLLVLHTIPCVLICTVKTKNRSMSHPVI